MNHPVLVRNTRQGRKDQRRVVLLHSYETVVVFDGTLSDDVLRKEQSSVESFLSKNAVFDKTVVWGKQELANQIRRRRTGFYCLFLYQGGGDLVARLEAGFRLNQNILRYLTVLQTTAPAAAPAKAAAAAVVAAEEEASHV